MPAALTLAAILFAVVALAVLAAAATSRPQSNNGLRYECDRPTVTRHTANRRQ